MGRKSRGRESSVSHTRVSSDKTKNTRCSSGCENASGLKPLEDSHSTHYEQKQSVQPARHPPTDGTSIFFFFVCLMTLWWHECFEEGSCCCRHLIGRFLCFFTTVKTVYSAFDRCHPQSTASPIYRYVLVQQMRYYSSFHYNTAATTTTTF